MVRWRERFGEMQYKCAHPDCTYSAARSFLIGKRSLCAVCLKMEMILTIADLRMAKPRCINCSDTAEAKATRELLAARAEQERLEAEQGETNVTKN
jgi:hypothetical protein